MTEKIELMLKAEKGIIPNMMHSLEMYKMADPMETEDAWEAEFLYWRKLTFSYSTGIADDYLQRFKEIKKSKRK